MRRLRSFLGSLMPAGLTGAFLVLCLARISEPGSANRLALLILGWLYGVAVLGLIRLFRVNPGLYPVVGLVCGPVPLALIANSDMGQDDLAGMWVLTLHMGVVIGAVEWGRLRRRELEPLD